MARDLDIITFMSIDQLLKTKPLVGLSPMAGYTDSPYRTICRQLGADFVVTELVSAEGVVYSYKAGNKITKSFELMRFTDGERPIFIQLFGADPVSMGEAAKIIAGELQPDGIDINMGCPAHKVVCSGKGSALMKNPDLAGQIVKSVIASGGLPTTVKTRIGWSDDQHLLDFSSAIEQAGASWIAIHGRTYNQGFGGEANWEPIYKVKDKLKIPVLGNGDIRTGEDAVRLIGNLDGVLIGRGTVGNPWIFKEVKERLVQSQKSKVQNYGNSFVSWDEKFSLLRWHAKMEYEQKGERGLIEMRKFMPLYIKGLPQASQLRLIATQIKSLDDVEMLIKNISLQLSLATT